MLRWKKRSTFEAKGYCFASTFPHHRIRLLLGKRGGTMISICRSMVVAGIFGAGAIAVAALPVPNVGLSYSYHPGTTRKTTTTIETAVEYDGDRRELTMRCTKSNSGNCRFAVDNAARQNVVSVHTGNAATLSNILENGRICSGGADLVPASCSWTPIEDPAATLS